MKQYPISNERNQGMKLVYIAGPYHGPDFITIDYHIAIARSYAAQMAKKGIGFICPHMNSAHFEVITPEVPEDWWKELDIRLLQTCDAVFLLPDWVASDGARKEKAWGELLGIPVFTRMSELEAWAGKASNRPLTDA